MGILANKGTRVIVQGITGKEGQFHTRLMREYGDLIVAGVTPGKYGETVLGIPVFDTVKEALEQYQADTSVLFVPNGIAKEAILEAIDAGIKLIVAVTEGIPVQDAMWARAAAKDAGAVLIGPNTPGLLTVGECLLGIMDSHHVLPGRIGVVSRSGTLTVETTAYLVEEGLGQSTVVGIGGDPVVGSTFVDILKLFNADEGTDAVAIIGEIGGTKEEDAAEYIGRHMTKPVAAFIPGKNAPEGKRLGHAGAIVEGNRGTAEGKKKALKEAGVMIAEVPWELGALLKSVQSGSGTKRERNPT
jgi:succinyl-CoA synthetase alpha subunit